MHLQGHTSSRMPGNHVHGNGLPATFVPGRRNVCEGYWVANESRKKLHALLFHCFLTIYVPIIAILDIWKTTLLF